MYTSYSVDELDLILKKSNKIYFIGIGGISMSSLAHISMSMGFCVSGYDRTPSELTRTLENDGAKIFYELSPTHVEDAQVIVYTAAIGKDNPELERALERDKEGSAYCVYRADFLGYLMSSHKNRIGVAGMHGKSTVTSMISTVFLEAKLNPTIVSGAVLPELMSAYRIGSREHFIMEACEYQDSFLSFVPNIAVILNIDMDHPDYFSGIEQIKDSFKKYANIASDGYAVANSDCGNTMAALANYKGKLVTFGLDSPADFTAKNISYEYGKPRFDIYREGKFLLHAELSVTGKHNIMNSLAVAAVSYISGVDTEAIKRGLARFTGAKRRMELRGYVSGLENGAKVPLYDDYAHHPTEIKATLSGVINSGFKRVFVVFQPHTYSRTHELFSEFAASFDGVCLILADIYAARETNTFGVSSEKLAAAIPGALYLPTNEQICSYLRKNLKDGDMLIIMGAGDIISIDSLLL